MGRKNWIAVACAEHARHGCADPQNGFMQVCHGQSAPLKKVSAGDRVAYYAPMLAMGGKDKFQRFVSIGVVQAGQPYAFDVGGGFVPFRRNVAYAAAREVSILPWLDEFEFVEDRRHWGYKFRFGLLAISEHDMRLVARAMRADLAALGFEAAGAAAAAPLRPMALFPG